MTKNDRIQSSAYKPGKVFIIALYLFYLAEVGRTLGLLAGDIVLRGLLARILGMQILFLVLFSLFLWRPFAPRLLVHLYSAFQSALIVATLVMVPDADFITGLFLPLSYQVSLNLCGGPRRAWVVILAGLCCVPLMLIRDPLHSLSLELSTMAGIIVIAAYIAAAQEEDAARAQSQAMLNELRETHHQLQAYASQVEELAAIDERNRLARELHDSVSQTMFSIILNVRASQMLLQRDPTRLRPQLERLNSLSQSALAEMRSLITQLRPKSE